jgi:hypothetical protein
MFDILTLVILVMVIAICMYNKQNVEGFYTYPGYYKKYCGSCGTKSRRSCGSCTNCGTCVTPNGLSECVPGDSSGPYFRSDCMYWEYGDPYQHYPYSHSYPSIKTYENYPFYRWNLRGPQRWGARNRNVRNKLKNEARKTRNLRARLTASQQ